MRSTPALVHVERAFNGEPPLFGTAIAEMFALKHQALALMKTPSGDGTHVGLSFDPPG